MQNSQDTHQKNDHGSHNDRRVLGGLECHVLELNKKPEQLKAALA
jgi:hypothetical protein